MFMCSLVQAACSCSALLLNKYKDSRFYICAHLSVPLYIKLNSIT